MKIRRIAGFAASVAVGALVLTACSSTPSDTESTSAAAEGTSTGIVTANSSEPQNPLVPGNINEVGGGKVVDLLFAGLVYYDAAGEPHNEVAESIETTDAQNYTITLKSGLTYSNDEPVIAKNFVDAWNYTALLSNAQLGSYFFEDIEGFSYDEDSALTGLAVVDDTSFTVKLKEPRADFPLRLGYSAFFPLPEVAFTDIAAFGENPIGNGPYMLAKEGAWQHNVGIDLIPNPAYEGDRTAKNGGVTFTFYASQEAAYNDLLADQLDVLDAVPDSAFGTFEDELGDRAVNQPAAVFQSFTIPQNLPGFSGEEGALRRAAISMAINRPEITDAIFQGTRTPANDFTSPVIAGWSDTIPGAEVLDYNETEAKALWAEADAIAPYTGTFTIGYNADGGHQAWVDAVTNSIKNTLGIASEGNPYPDFKSFRDDVTNRTITGAFRTGWQADYPGLFNFLGPIYATDASSNDGDYTNPEFDALLADGSTAATVDEANKLFQQAQEILFTDLPAIPLWYSNVTGGSAATVDNVEFGWNSVPLYYEVTKS
ncbi:peptide ABC transporter substrate-binding protein [Pengzhenrongella frigida]|uniref:ABC transporter substrate-binding protein n=1 Tax=Pengzhenrongella frigida TaxID=1259133 RepID=A0A4Q5N1L4_9MICO|nr:ABC transporter substrate-binding protein [Cellulomonas sp. HLT2-17]RYV51979.1 ABC transporter substrate-binding protein [Cellulomonas sp. HLT2-17]